MDIAFPRSFIANLSPEFTSTIWMKYFYHNCLRLHGMIAENLSLVYVGFYFHVIGMIYESVMSDGVAYFFFSG